MSFLTFFYFLVFSVSFFEVSFYRFFLSLFTIMTDEIDILFEGELEFLKEYTFETNEQIKEKFLKNLKESTLKILAGTIVGTSYVNDVINKHSDKDIFATMQYPDEFNINITLLGIDSSIELIMHETKTMSKWFRNCPHYDAVLNLYSFAYAVEMKRKRFCDTLSELKFEYINVYDQFDFHAEMCSYYFLLKFVFWIIHN